MLIRRRILMRIECRRRMEIVICVVGWVRRFLEMGKGKFQIFNGFVEFE